MRQYRGQRVGALLRIAVLADPGQAGRSGVWKMSRAQMICIQVVPLRDRVLITMSPGRNVNPSQRALS